MTSKIRRTLNKRWLDIPSEVVWTFGDPPSVSRPGDGDPATDYSSHYTLTTCFMDDIEMVHDDAATKSSGSNDERTKAVAMS